MRNVLRLFAAAATQFTLSAAADSSGPPVPDTLRAYPPSCLADPLSAIAIPPPNAGGSNTEVWSTVLTLPALAPGQTGPIEPVEAALVLWRTPCTGGEAALLGMLQRIGGTASLPFLFPKILVESGPDHVAQLRVAAEPNTIRSQILPGTPVDGFVVFVFERSGMTANNVGEAQPLDGSFPNFRDALTFTFDSGVESFAPGTLSIPAYDMTKYPDASLPMQIGGYQSGNWYAPDHAGEGIQIEVGDLYLDGAPTGGRYITAAWYTYDPSGRPYWLFGSGTFTVGARTADLTLAYSSDGGFAGNFGPAAKQASWGTMSVAFADCETMNFSYAWHRLRMSFRQAFPRAAAARRTGVSRR